MLLTTCSALASGWNDFEQPIGSGYSIFRNTGVRLCHNGTEVIREPVQNIVAFAVTPTHILTKHQNHGSDHADFFVTEIKTEKAVGPLPEKDFLAHPNVSSLSTIGWSVPTNPHPEVARDGQRVFIAFMVVLFAGPPLAVVVMVVLVMALLRWRRKRRGREVV